MGELPAVWADGAGTERRTMVNFAWLVRLSRAGVPLYPR